MKYFLHDSDSFNDEKIAELFLQFGYEGLGLFYTVLEMLSKQEGPIKTAILKNRLHVGKKLEKCWKFMESLGIICSNNGETFNEKILNKSEKYKIKKGKTRKRVSLFRKNQRLKKNVTPDTEISEQLRSDSGNADVSASKISIRKDNNKRESAPPVLKYVFSEEDLPVNLRTQAFIAKWQEWLTYRRKETKKAVGIRGATADLKMLAAETDPIGVIQQSLDKEWRGLFSKKTSHAPQVSTLPAHKQQKIEKSPTAVFAKRGMFD